ncbi:MAG: hypothetical protein FJ263_03610 [Planctomycetes bacterium]|nr:hypothetical protein [Planctomycetota bacterium]
MFHDNVSKQSDLNIEAPKPLSSKCDAPQKVNDNRSDAVVNMTRETFDKMMFSICPRPAETGGLILGPLGSNDGTDFFFDAGGSITGTSYAPDCVTIVKKLKEEWIPAGIDLKGIAHSHPGKLDRLTTEDMAYIKRLLIINPEMPVFLAPLIIPHEFRMRMMVVFRDNPDIAVEARINFF